MNRTVLVLLLMVAVTYANVDDVIRDYTKESESVETREIANEYGTYTLFTINGVDSLLVENSDFYLITNPLVIYSALKHEYLADNEVSVDMETLIGYVDGFNASRYPEQSTCEQYTGTDRLECTDFATCRYACLSVPLCRSVFEGQGDGFVYSIQNWMARNMEIDSSMGSFKNAVLGIPDNPEMANSAWDYLTVIEEQAALIKGNKMFLCDSGGYCFCYGINFSLGKIDDCRAGLTQIKEVLSELPNLEKKADFMESITKERIREKDANDVVYQYQQTYGEVIGNFTGTVAYASDALVLVDSGLLSENITALTSIKDEMRMLGEDKNYSGAISLKETYFEQAGVTSKYAKRLIGKYADVNESVWRMEERIANETNLTSLGGYFYEEFSGIEDLLADLADSLKPPAEEDMLPVIGENLTLLDSRLSALKLKARSATELLDEIVLVRGRLEELTSKAEEYKQQYDITEISESLSSARAYIIDGQVEKSENIIMNASVGIDELNTRLEVIIPLIDEATGKAFEASLYIEERKGA
ncbi:MAG: hypothetical protein ABIG39_06030, partial [Candidatus Micrarchaeota archaeon]